MSEQKQNQIDAILADLKLISIGVQFSLCHSTGEIKRSDIKRELAEIENLVIKVEQMKSEETPLHNKSLSELQWKIHSLEALVEGQSKAAELFSKKLAQAKRDPLSESELRDIAMAIESAIIDNKNKGLMAVNPAKAIMNELVNQLKAHGIGVHSC
jgi:predicted RNase H-like nuclease (RuvC/YqgF family)